MTSRERLARLSRGGNVAWPIEVTSASVVEVRTASLVCPECELGDYRIEEHVAPAAGLRRVDVRCRYCATPRSLWFRLVSNEPN